MKWGEPCIWVPCGCSPSIPEIWVTGRAYHLLHENLKADHSADRSCQSWCQVPPVSYVWVGTYLGSADSPVPKEEKQSCFLVRLSRWLTTDEAVPTAFWIIALSKKSSPSGFSWNFLLCTELRNFPRRFEWEQLLDSVAQLVQAFLYFSRRNKPGICCSSTGAMNLTLPAPFDWSPSDRKGTRQSKILAASLVVCCAKMWLALCYLCAAAPPVASQLLLCSLQQPRCGLWRTKAECCLNLGREQETQTPSHHFLKVMLTAFS